MGRQCVNFLCALDQSYGIVASSHPSFTTWFEPLARATLHLADKPTSDFPRGVANHSMADSYRKPKTVRHPTTAGKRRVIHESDPEPLPNQALEVRPLPLFWPLIAHGSLMAHPGSRIGCLWVIHELYSAVP